ncbi:unnamed protein product [Pocillopora meandrina]|uniref:PHD-type domain-containing protein n=1 Tax=Pocillopora meandrina TaxID=46732 RepID=A0AAU9XIQ0_9CNID|nr:unnamed protein product [Pocillopora meandrina]
MEEFYCVFCAEIVTSRQEALLCGGCDRWQHRRCHTGVDRATYRQAVRTGQDILWTCIYCTDKTPVPVAASSMINTDSSTPSALPELSLPVSSPSDLGTVMEVTMFSAPPSPTSGTRIEEEPSPGIIESSIEEPLL